MIISRILVVESIKNDYEYLLQQLLLLFYPALQRYYSKYILYKYILKTITAL